MIQAHLIHSKLHARLQWGQWLSRHVFKNGCVCHFQFKCLSQCCFWAKPSPHEIIRRFKGRVWVTFLTWAVSCCVMCAETFHSDTNFCFCLQSPVLPPLFPTYASDAAATIHNLTWLPHTFSLLSYSLPGSKVTSHSTWYYNQNIGACLILNEVEITGGPQTLSRDHKHHPNISLTALILQPTTVSSHLGSHEKPHSFPSNHNDTTRSNMWVTSQTAAGLKAEEGRGTDGASKTTYTWFGDSMSPLKVHFWSDNNQVRLTNMGWGKDVKEM